jgi:hypothetical protein
MGCSTVTLELTGKGTLSGSVDGKPAVKLFHEMLSKFEGHKEKGFVPAVSMMKPGSVRFLGFE